MAGLNADNSLGSTDNTDMQHDSASLQSEYPPSTYAAPDRSQFLARDVVSEIWRGLGSPPAALQHLVLPGDNPAPALPSSFKIGILAQGVIASSALAAAEIHALRSGTCPDVEVAQQHAVVEFKSEQLYLLDGKQRDVASNSIGGLHKTSDGHVRVHDGFPNHVDEALSLLALPRGATRQQVAEKISHWTAVDFETAATVERKFAAYALRTYEQWDALPQSTAISNFPIDIARVAEDGPRGLPERLAAAGTGCLTGVRVVEMSRVIAAPLAGRTLAAHGADVIWVTSPTLPDLPKTDCDLARGKRTVQLDIRKEEDKAKLIELLREADIFIQGYRPGALESRGLGPADLVKINPNLVFVNLSAFGPRGPWAKRRGYDSLVQTCSGMNASEAEHYGKGAAAMPMPCQALDHAGGYLLATAAMTGLYRRIKEGGSWRVDVSLAGVMKYLRSLGQYPGTSGFSAKNYLSDKDVPPEYYELRDSGLGELKAITHGAKIQGVEVGWKIMPKPLGSDKAEWLQ